MVAALSAEPCWGKCQADDVLTPEQQVRFYSWYDRNRKRIHDCGMDRGLAQELAKHTSKATAAAAAVAGAGASVTPEQQRDKNIIGEWLLVGVSGRILVQDASCRPRFSFPVC